MQMLMAQRTRAEQRAREWGASAMSAGAEEVLKSYTIPANTFNVVGRKLKVVFSGTTAANANNKTFRIRLGGLTGTAIFTSAALAFNNRVWRIEVIVEVRLVPDSQVSVTHFLSNSTVVTEAVDVEEGTATQDDAADIVLAMTGQATAAGDIVCQRMTVDWYEAP